MILYLGERSCPKLYDGVISIDVLIARLEGELHEVRRMKEADIEVLGDSGEEGTVMFYSPNPDTVESFGFWEEADGQPDEDWQEDSDDDSPSGTGFLTPTPAPVASAPRLATPETAATHDPHSAAIEEAVQTFQVSTCACS